MDRHHPAYWLSRDPSEAAAFLARTAVASRTVGGFVKAGAMPSTNDTLINAALGAGVGGLGGLGVGLMSRRKKSPLTSALTGAALGGTIGATAPVAYGAAKDWAQKLPDTLSTPETKAQADAYNKLNDFWKIWYKATGGAPPVTQDDPLKEPLTDVDKAKGKEGYGELFAKGTGKAIAAPIATAAGVARDYPSQVAGHLGFGAVQAAHFLRNKLPGERWRLAREGAAAMEGAPGTGSTFTKTVKSDPFNTGSVTTEKMEAGKPPANLDALRLKRFVTDVTPGVNKPGWNPLTWTQSMRDAHIGRELGAFQRSGPYDPKKPWTYGGASMEERYGPIKGTLGTPDVQPIPARRASPGVRGSRARPGKVGTPGTPNLPAMDQAILDTAIGNASAARTKSPWTRGRIAGNLAMYFGPHLAYRIADALRQE